MPVASRVRAPGQGLNERLGQPVVIDNRPGASQAIGAEATAKAQPDGYTIFMGTQSGLALNTIARKSLPYDPVKDFAPVSMLFTSPLYLVVHPTVPASPVQELVAEAHRCDAAIAHHGEIRRAGIPPENRIRPQFFLVSRR